MLVVPRLPRSLSTSLTVVGYGLSFLCAAISLAWPLGNDQTLFTLVAQEILRGGVPYRDVWEIKGPLTHYVYAFSLAIWGRPEISIRALDLLATCAFVLLLRKLVLRLNGANVFGAHCAVIFYLLAYYGNGFWHTAQPDGWGAMLVTASVLLSLDAPRNARWSAAANGVLLAMATLLKPTFLIFAPLPLLSALDRSQPTSSRIRAALGYIATFCVTIGASLLMLFEMSGSLDDFLDVMRFVLSSYVPDRVNVGAKQLLFASALALPLAVAGFGIALMKVRGMGREAALVSAWLALCIAAVVLQGRYYPYHWIPSFVAIAAGLGVFFGTIERAPALVLAAFLCTLGPAAGRALSARYDWDWWAPYYSRVSVYAAEHAGPNDRVLMWGEIVSVYMSADRRAPTRFVTSQPLATSSPVQGKYQQIFLRELSTHPPLYIFVDTAEWAFERKTGVQLLNEFPAFARFLHTRYTHESTLDRFEVWRLDSAGRAVAAQR
jgi:hypothetical protein